MKDLKKVNILINGDENSKTEVVYNNVIQNMGLTEEEQLKYLKSKINDLELELRNKTITILLTIISILGVGLGLFLMIQDLHLIGSIFIVTTFIGVIIRFYMMYKNVISIHKNSEYDKIEQLRKLLNDRIR